MTTNTKYELTHVHNKCIKVLYIKYTIVHIETKNKKKSPYQL